MPSNITVYNSYKKGLKTFSGSFPIYDQTIVAGCNVVTNAQAASQAAANLKELDEFANLDYLIIPYTNNSSAPKFNPDDPNIAFNPVVNINDIDPNMTGLVTFDQLIIN
jgi:hypothetical protein